MQVEIRRGTGVQRFSQELLADWPDLKITLQVLDTSFIPRQIDAATTLRPGSMLIWYLLPGEPYEIGAFFHRRGALLGHYLNLVRQPDFNREPWVIDDLYLDIWVPANGPAVVLDQDDLAAAVEGGALTDAEAQEIRSLGERLLRRAREDRWMPARVRRWPGELVPALRLLRDSPGTFHAARLSGRIIAYGLYLMALVSATSIAYAALTDAFVVSGTAQRFWMMTILAEAIVLAPLALGGKLPATHWPRPPLVDERSLFVATLASGLAVLSLNERAGWASALLPVYGVLGLFSLIFAVCRLRFDRQIPVFALAGVLITLVALAFLI